MAYWCPMSTGTAAKITETLLPEAAYILGE